MRVDCVSCLWRTRSVHTGRSLVLLLIGASVGAQCERLCFDNDIHRFMNGNRNDPNILESNFQLYCCWLYFQTVAKV